MTCALGVGAGAVGQTADDDLAEAALGERRGRFHVALTFQAARLALAVARPDPERVAVAVPAEPDLRPGASCASAT